MGFRDAMTTIFGGQPGTQAAATVPVQGTQTDPNKQAAPGSGNKLPQQGESAQLEASGAGAAKATSPLDGYKDLWSNTPAEGSENKPQPNQPQNQNPPNPQPQVPQFITAAKGLNFSRNIKPELMSKALGGDVTAFAEIIDTVGRGAFAAAGQYAEKHYATSSGKLKEEISGSLPDKFREYSLQNTPIKHPVLARPEVKPMVEGLRLQLAQKFPEASTQELQQKAEDYFLAWHKEMGMNSEAELATQNKPAAGSQIERQTQQQKGEFDWDKDYLGMTN